MAGKSFSANESYLTPVVVIPKATFFPIGIQSYPNVEADRAWLSFRFPLGLSERISGRRSTVLTNALLRAFCWIFLLFSVPVLWGQSPSQQTRWNFNADWRVLVGDPAGAEQPNFDDSTWKRVTTPYAWNEDSSFRVSIHDLPTGIAWYRKHFRLPRSSAGKKIFLEFDGIRQDGEVYLNGRWIGRHEDGVMAFGFDITDLVKPAPEENVLAVRTDNSWDYRQKSTGATFRWNNRNFYANYGGISKSVWLVTTNKLYQTQPLFSDLGTTGVYIWPSDFDIPVHTARVTAQSQVRNEEAVPEHVQYGVIVRDPQQRGRIVSRFTGESATIAPSETRILSASAVLHGLHFWSWGYGYLYDVTTTLSVGGHTVDAVTTRTGFRETEFGHGMIRLNGRVIMVHGYGQRTTNEWPAVGLSVPPWMSDFSNRLMVKDNADLVRWMHVTPWKQDIRSFDRLGLMEAMPAGDAEGDSSGAHWQQRLALMRDAIIYNRDDPSILFYESGNHGISEQHMAQMKAIRDKYDPHGGRAIGAREMLDSKLAEYGGEMLYIDKSAGKPLWAHEYSRDEAARKYLDNFSPPFHLDSPLYNRNQDSQAVEDVRRWFDYWRERPGSGTRVSSGGVKIIFSDSNTHFRGDNNYRRSGAVGPMRIPKQSYYANQVMWDGWVNVDHPGIHISGHWNYAPGTVKPIYVVSSAEKVELRLNGKSLGYGAQSSRFLFTFPHVAFQPGTLEAIGYDDRGHEEIHAELHTAGAPVALRLTLHTGPGGLRADGADMVLVDVEVVDAKGRRCPTALNLVHFHLSGPAEWRGGIAQGPNNYILATSLPVENGMNRVIVRSTPRAGVIRLRATADGMRPAQITFRSRPFPVAGGLSRVIPGTALQPYLERGPTPDEPSFHPWRTSIVIQSATAGANANEAPRSYDDNEKTAWENDGHLDTAWIEYTFAQPQTPTELDLKLNNFRHRRYPLRVSVDGQTVWEGLTPVSLGYCLLRLRPVQGTHLRIALTAPPEAAQEYAGSDEITGKIDGSGVASHATGRAVLSIIEADIYKPASNSPAAMEQYREAGGAPPDPGSAQ